MELTNHSPGVFEGLPFLKCYPFKKKKQLLLLLLCPYMGVSVAPCWTGDTNKELWNNFLTTVFAVERWANPNPKKINLNASILTNLKHYFETMLKAKRAKLLIRLKECESTHCKKKTTMNINREIEENEKIGNFKLHVNWNEFYIIIPKCLGKTCWWNDNLQSSAFLPVCEKTSNFTSSV